MNALELKGLTKTFPGFSLDHIDLTLPSGCIMGLIGENGAGKSTTIKLILDILHKDSGSVTILGRDNQNDIRLTKEDVGVVLDEAGVPGCLTAKQVGKIMRRTFTNWDAGEYARLLDKLSLPESKPFGDLSRGMKMKLGIAVALSHHPKLLLLDEPTNGLDPVVRDAVVEMFLDFTRDEDHSILISSHIVSDLEKLCDYVAFLHQGRLLLCEEKDQLLEEYGILHCTGDQLDELDRNAVLYQKLSPYGAQALVSRKAVPDTLTVSPVSIEELFVFMVKGGNRS
jgi:ABC-2 type transport system ATP-binding protein